MQRVVGTGVTVSDLGTWRIPTPARFARQLVARLSRPIAEEEEEVVDATSRQIAKALARTLLSEPIIHLPELTPLSPLARLTAFAALQRVCIARMATSVA